MAARVEESGVPAGGVPGRTPAWRRLATGSAYAGLAVLETAVAVAYAGRGTWWHYLLHQLVGWGVGLAVAGLLMALRRGLFIPPLLAALAGQLVSITPDLMFRYLRMPHTRAMDLWLGHISLHRGLSPVLVALGVLLLGGWSWLAAAQERRRPALALAVAAVVLLATACLLAVPLPDRLGDYENSVTPSAR